MKRPHLNVFVELENHHQALYSQGNVSAAWCTEVEVTRDGSLRLWQGWNIRLFHPAGEWKSYSVSLAPNDVSFVHDLRPGDRGHRG